MLTQRIPDSLRAGRRALEGILGVTIVEDWRPLPNTALWHLLLRLSLEPVEAALSDYVPVETDWFVVTSMNYPVGLLEFYPAKNGGLTATFAHQNFNSLGSDDVPWRDGNICLTRPLQVLGRTVPDDADADAGSRLLWMCLRALEWLRAARDGELFFKGEPWELPDFRRELKLPAKEVPTLVFSEDAHSFDFWQQSRFRCGLAELGSWRRDPPTHFVRSFSSPTGTEILRTSWGRRLEESDPKRNATAIWLLLNSVPVRAPWQAPTTWRELREAVEEQGLDLYDLLLTAKPQLRGQGRQIAMVGFPIPSVVGGENSRVHWQPLLLPPLPLERKGFSSTSEGRKIADRVGPLRGECVLDWLRSSNWNPEQLSTRGRAAPQLRDHRVLLVGAGALGSAVAELLVRSGVHHLTILDGDVFSPGNLVRHTLTMDDVDGPKALSLAARLNMASPHAQVRAAPVHFPPVETEHLKWLNEVSLVLECTGEDQALNAIARFNWLEDKLFVSCSLGWKGHQIWCYSSQGKALDAQEFRRQMAPFLEAQARKYGEEMELTKGPREGIGCWHPVFPLRPDDLWLLSAIAVKHLERVALDPPVQASLSVWEQNDDGICRVSSGSGG